MNVDYANESIKGRVGYTAVKIESGVVEGSGEGVLSLEVLTDDNKKAWIDIEGLTPGMLLDAVLANQAQD